MSVFRIKDSKDWQFDFQRRGHRFSESTKCIDEEAAKTYEAEEISKAERLLDQIEAGNSAP